MKRKAEDEARPPPATTVTTAPARWPKARKLSAKLLRPVPEPEPAAAAEPAPSAGRRSRPASSNFGSHFAQPPPAQSVNDEWQTTHAAWADVAPVLASWRSKRVWQPFYYDGACARHLTVLGFTRVVHQEADFFARARDPAFLATVDVILDNPPYTAAETKEAVLQALLATGKPFCVLLPSSVLFSQLLRDLVPDTARIQAILPRRVLVCKTGHPPVPFKFLAWLCVDCQLERDLFFVGE